MTNDRDSEPDSGRIESLLGRLNSDYLAEDCAPPIDIERLRALARRELTAERAQIIYELCASFRSWNDAYDAILADELAKEGGTPFPTTRGEGFRKSRRVTYQTAGLISLATLILVAGTSLYLLWQPRRTGELRDGEYQIVMYSDGRLQGLPPMDGALANEIRSALGSQGLRDIPELPRMPGQRGSVPSHSKSALREPFRTRVRSERPEFSWKPVPGAEHYQVLVYNDSGQVVTDSGQIVDGTTWTPDSGLNRGVTMSWAVIAVANGQKHIAPPAGEERPAFQILSLDDESRLDDASKKLPNSRLARGILYVTWGLLSDADVELRALAVENPNSPQLQKLLIAVESLRE